jgi:hypothetical protein
MRPNLQITDETIAAKHALPVIGHQSGSAEIEELDS